MKKRIFALSLCLILCLSLIPAAFAASPLDVAEDAIEKNLKSVFVDNDTTEESLTYALQKLIPEGNPITVTVQFTSKTNATTEKRGSIGFKYFLYDPDHKYTTSGSYHILRIPVAEVSQSEVDMIEGDVAAARAAILDYFATTKVDSSDIVALNQQMLTFQKAVSDSVVNGSTAVWPGVDFDVSVKQGYIRGVLHLSYGAQTRKVMLDAVINADGSVTVKELALTIMEAIPTNDKLTVNGVLQTPTVYKIDGGNYFKLRDLAVLLNGTASQFDVGYDAASNSVTATSGKGYTRLDSDMQGPASGSQTATRSNDKIIVNGQAAEVTAYKIAGGNYFKLRDLGAALGFEVGWDDANKVASITTNG